MDMRLFLRTRIVVSVFSGILMVGCQSVPVTADNAANENKDGATNPTSTSALSAESNCHTHPPIPGCTKSVTHCHPYNNINHTHSYKCGPSK